MSVSATPMRARYTWVGYMPAVTWYHTRAWHPDSPRIAPRAERTHSPRRVKSVNCVDRERTRSSMRRCESCRTRRATSFGNRFQLAGGAGPSGASTGPAPSSGGSGMAAAWERSRVKADVGVGAGATRDRNWRGRACRPSMSG
eukprot:3688107-Rhodomonas_salina.1